MQRSLMSCTEPRLFTSSLTQRVCKAEDRQGAGSVTPCSRPGVGLSLACSASLTPTAPCKRRRGHSEGSRTAPGPRRPACLPAESRGIRAGCPCQRGSAGPHGRTGPAGNVSDYSSRSASRRGGVIKETVTSSAHFAQQDGREREE